MIFISDLDRTLIFSKMRFDNNIETIDAEYKENNPVGFMTHNAYKYLKDIQKNTVFVANTLREIEQAKRITFINDGSCKYISTQNGLYLYCNGIQDKTWSGIVMKKANETIYDLDKAISIVMKNIAGIDCMSKKYEYLAVFFTDVDKFDNEAYKQLRINMVGDGWELFIQGKKMYLLPLNINKGSVLEYIKEIEYNNDICAGFGDSYFDIPMLKKCNIAYSLYKSEIYETVTDKEITFSEKPDILGSEEILNKFLNEYLL